MKQGWEVKTIENVCSFFGDGDWIESKDQSTDGVRLVQTGNVGAGFFKDRGGKARYVSQDTFERLRCTEIIGGDCLISRLPDPVGRGCILPNTGEKMITAVDCTIIRFDKNTILPNWFVLYTLSNEYQRQINSQVSGATRQRISRKNLGLIEIPLPPIQEQQRIVAILDEAFAAIAQAKANAEQNLKNAKELFESYLQSVFENKGEGWELCNLETYIKLIDYRGRTPVKTENGVRLITAKNVKLGYLQLEPQEFIAENNYENWMTRGIPNFGDVIFTTEAPLANVAQIDSNDKVAFAQRIIVMQPEPSKLNQTFLKYMLLSNPIRNKILGKGTGATVLGIKSSLLKKIEIYFPNTIIEQQAIVQRLDALSAETKQLETIYQQKINDLDELKKSILQKAFAGELNTTTLEV
jgi:type I restriction enzyme S subunit